MRSQSTTLPTYNSSYGVYMASREWALKKRSVKARSGGKCERCGAPSQNVHHVTYERLYHERLDDLLDVCRPCHAFLSAETDIDPAAKVGPMNEREWQAFLNSPLRKLFERHMA